MLAVFLTHISVLLVVLRTGMVSYPIHRPGCAPDIYYLFLNKKIENEVTPEMVLGLKASLFNKKCSCLTLIPRYFIWICKTQEKPLEMGNFQSFASTVVFVSF